MAKKSNKKKKPSNNIIFKNSPIESYLTIKDVFKALDKTYGKGR